MYKEKDKLKPSMDVITRYYAPSVLSSENALYKYMDGISPCIFFDKLDKGNAEIFKVIGTGASEDTIKAVTQYCTMIRSNGLAKWLRPFVIVEDGQLAFDYNKLHTAISYELTDIEAKILNRASAMVEEYNKMKALGHDYTFIVRDAIKINTAGDLETAELDTDWIFGHGLTHCCQLPMASDSKNAKYKRAGGLNWQILSMDANKGHYGWLHHGGGQIDMWVNYDTDSVDIHHYSRKIIKGIMEGSWVRVYAGKYSELVDKELSELAQFKTVFSNRASWNESVFNRIEANYKLKYL